MPGMDGPGGSSNLFRPSGLQLLEQPRGGWKALTSPSPISLESRDFFGDSVTERYPNGGTPAPVGPCDATLLLAQHFHEV